MKSKQQQQPQCDGGGQVLNPPTDEEIRQFIDYLNGGVINDQRLEYEEERRRRRSEDEEGGDYDEATEEDETVENGEVQKRNRTASMYFYRHHYLSIIQEEEEIGGDHQAATPGSSRPTSNYGLPIVRTYLNNPVVRKALRESWGSEHSMDSLASINSILSEEAAAASSTSSTTVPPTPPSRPPPPQPSVGVVNSIPGKSDHLPGKSAPVYDRPRPIDRGATCWQAQQQQPGGHIWDHVPPPAEEDSSTTEITTATSTTRSPSSSASSTSPSTSTPSTPRPKREKRECARGTNPFEEEEETKDDPKIAHSQKPNIWVKLKSIINKGNKAGSGESSTMGKGRFSFKSPFQTLSRKNSNSEENLSLSQTPRKSSISSLRRRQRQENKKELTEKAIGEEADGKMGQVEQEEEEGEHEAAAEAIVTNGDEDGRENRGGNERRRRRTQKGGDNFAGHEKSYENIAVPRDKAPICRNQERKSAPPPPPPLSQPRLLSPRSRPNEKCSPSPATSPTSSNNKHLSEAANESAPRAAAASSGASLTALISECEDYIKTEEFTKELSDKILQMFVEERAKSEQHRDSDEDAYERISLVNEWQVKLLAEKAAVTLSKEAFKKDNISLGHPDVRPNDDSTTPCPPTLPPANKEEKSEPGERQPNTRKARMEKILERVSSESRAQLSFKDVVGIAGRDSMYENVDAGYETTDHKSPLKREKESSQPTSSEPSSDSAYYGTADNRAAVVSRDSRDSMTSSNEYESAACLTTTESRSSRSVTPAYSSISGGGGATTSSSSTVYYGAIIAEPQTRVYNKTPVAVTSQPVMLEDPIERRDRRDGGGECPLPSQHTNPNNPKGISNAQHSGFPLSAVELTSTPAKMTSPSNEDAAVDRIATVFDDLNGYLSDTATTSLDYKIQTERRRKKKREKTMMEQRRGEDEQCGGTERDALPSPSPSSSLAVVPTPAPRGDSRQRVRELLTTTQGISGSGGEERCSSSLSRCGGGGRATDLETIPETGELSGGMAPKPGYFSLPRSASAMARPLRNTPQPPPQPLIRSSSFVQAGQSPELGSLRRKKASRTASLSSLLLSHRDGDGALRSQLQMASPAPSTESATLERLNNARRWISESSLSTAASWTPGTVVVKECSCGNKVTFDPAEDMADSCSVIGSYGTDTDTVRGNNADCDDDNDSDYGSYDRKAAKDAPAATEGLYFAKFVDALPEPTPPPRPPPPPLNYADFCTLPRKPNAAAAAAGSVSDSAGLKRSLSLQRFDVKSEGGSAAAWMTALMDGDHVPDYPTPFDTFITRSNSQLNRA